jgi:hypothetical protein
MVRKPQSRHLILLFYLLSSSAWKITTGVAPTAVLVRILH